MRIKKKFTLLFSTVCLAVAMLIPNASAKLKADGYNYDPDAAVKYAIENADKDPEITSGDCANFVCHCLQAGGLPITRQTYTGPLYREIQRVTGIDWHGQDLRVNGSGYVTRDLNPDILAPGDVVFNWCPACPGYQGEKGVSPHVVICTGFDSQGRAKYCSHTSPKKDVAVNYTYKCSDCGTKLVMKVLHFDTATGSQMSSGYDRVLPDGDYIIASTARMDDYGYYYLDIDGSGNAASETDVHVFYAPADNIPDCDVWNIKYSNGFYRIKQKGSNMDLDVAGASQKAGTNVRVWENNQQTWAISYNSNKTGYRIQSKLSGFSLNASGNVDAGTNVNIASNNNSENQSWVLIPYKPSQPIANGRYVLLSKLASGWTMDVAGNTGEDTQNGQNVQIWTDAEGISKWNSFDFTKLSNGYYKVTHAASGKALDVEGWKTNYGTNISLYEYTQGALNQQWAIKKTSTGYALINRNSGMALDVEGAKVGDGVNIIEYPYHGEKCQSWDFVKAEYKVTYNANGGSGAPEAQTKYYKHTLKLSSTKPSRSNYTFKGWATSSTATTATYQPGANLTTNANVTLYAVWQANKPAAPSGVKAVSASSASVKVSWNAVSGVTGYQVWRATSANGTYTALGSVTTTNRTCTGLTAGTKYYFKVRAYKETNGTKTYGSFSSVVSAEPQLASPGSVKISARATTSLTVSWNYVGGATGYEVYRATTSNGTYSKLGEVTETSRKCPGLTSGKKYYFKVRAFVTVNGTKHYGKYSSVISGVTLLSTPTVKIASSTSTSVTLSWNAVSGATGYEAYRATSANGTYSKMGDVFTTSRKCPGLTTGKTYYFKVRAFVEIDGVRYYGNYSTVVSKQVK